MGKINYFNLASRSPRGLRPLRLEFPNPTTLELHISEAEGRDRGQRFGRGERSDLRPEGAVAT